MKTGRILVATNSEEIRNQLRSSLHFEGHEVAQVAEAAAVIREVTPGRHDLLILEAGFAMADAFSLCRSVRAKSELGIILLSGEDSGQIRIDALNAGADDFLPPGFAMAELMARVRAILRRVNATNGNHQQVLLPDRAIDFQSHEIKGPDGRIAHLTPKECLVLEHLVTHANTPLTPQNLARSVWQRDGSGQIEFVRIVVKQLRRKLEPDPDHPRYITTQRSVGYQFQMPA